MGRLTRGIKEAAPVAAEPIAPAARCDACSAAARVHVILAPSSELAFCQHHFNKHEDALMHKLADLLYVPIAELMAAKDRAKRKMRER